MTRFGCETIERSGLHMIPASLVARTLAVTRRWVLAVSSRACFGLFWGLGARCCPLSVRAPARARTSSGSPRARGGRSAGVDASRGRTRRPVPSLGLLRALAYRVEHAWQGSSAVHLHETVNASSATSVLSPGAFALAAMVWRGVDRHGACLPRPPRRPRRRRRCRRPRFAPCRAARRSSRRVGPRRRQGRHAPSYGAVSRRARLSDVRLGVVPRVECHPLPSLVEAAARCTVNTDDPFLFDRDLIAEHRAARALGAGRARASMRGGGCARRFYRLSSMNDGAYA